MGNLHFNVGDTIKANGSDYIVEGLIVFINEADNLKWTEYKIRQLSSRKVKWLSIDNDYEEYAIYTQAGSKKGFSESEILSKGFKEADFGKANVISFAGNVDVENGDWVKYREFEDISEENIISIEEWEDETEYSTGYYLDENEITKVASSNNNANYGNINNFNNKESNGIFKKFLLFMLILMLFPVVVCVISAIFINNINKNEIADYLSSSGLFTYTTSITSDLNNNEKADVYSTALSVEEAAKSVIDCVNGDVEDIQENAEDGTVGIMTKYEYCLVYTDTENQTLAQISQRSYVYSSTNNPYRSTNTTARYFRRHYYTIGYSSDSSRYKKYTSGYDNYDDGYIDTDSNNKYKTYSNSVRQSSVNSRTSSGGGTSSGK
ncbi:MAG: DUF4178 domain-containing protein [Clostridium sp.]|nr:DUF4178 domain-containing protein [Clostridium sp.]